MARGVVDGAEEHSGKLRVEEIVNHNELNRLLAASLHFKPVGTPRAELKECGEARELVDAWNTGHPGGRVALSQNDTVGHAVTIGPTGSGKSWFMESLLESRKVNGRAAVRAAQTPSAPYYRQFDKRK
jgi:hypothetical protein